MFPVFVRSLAITGKRLSNVTPEKLNLVLLFLLIWLTEQKDLKSHLTSSFLVFPATSAFPSEITIHLLCIYLVYTYLHVCLPY